MDINTFWNSMLANLGVTTKVNNVNEWRKQYVAITAPAAKAVTLSAAKTVTAAESGTTFFLNLAGGFTTTLPAPARGLNYRFVVSLNPTTAYIIVTNGSANIIKGGINELEVDTSDDGPYINNGDQLNFVANLAVVGDYVDFISDGTSWFIRGQTNVDGGITLAST